MEFLRTVPRGAGGEGARSLLGSGIQLVLAATGEAGLECKRLCRKGKAPWDFGSLLL